MCSKLSLLYCQNNMLTLLTLGNASTLRDLDCSQNQLSSLIATSCTSLTQLTCDNNNIRILDISNCYNLGDLIWHNNPFEEINLGMLHPLHFTTMLQSMIQLKQRTIHICAMLLNNSTKLKITSSRYSRVRRFKQSIGIARHFSISQHPRIVLYVQ